MVLARKAYLECLDALESRQVTEYLLMYCQVYALQATLLRAVTRDGGRLRLERVLCQVNKDSRFEPVEFGRQMYREVQERALPERRVSYSAGFYMVVMGV